MSNEVATQSASKPPMVANGGAIRPIIPQDFDQAWRIAAAVVTAGMAPKDMNTAEKCTIAIMHGMEVGLPPMAALQSIAVVNGRPTIWGDGALALVRASGLCDDIAEWVEGAGDKAVAFCEVRRRGSREPIARTFSAEQAKKAGLWSKAGPWTQYPERMLAMRARAFALRDGFADVLRGLHIKEEMEDVAEVPARQIERPSLPAPSAATRPAPQDRPADVERPKVQTPPAREVEPQNEPPTSVETPALPLDEPSKVEAPQLETPPIGDDPDPDAWSNGEFEDQPEDFEKQADQICDALEAAETKDALEALVEKWADRVAAMPKGPKARCNSVLKACRAKFKGG